MHDDSEFHAFYQIVEASRRFERPLATVWTELEAAVTLRRPDPSKRWEAFGVFDGETMVGAGTAERPLLDNTDMIFFDVDVAPELRRRDIGTDLVRYVVDRAKA